MFGRMPSHGAFVRHVRNVSQSNVELSSVKDDLRPAFALQDVQGAEYFRLSTPHVKDVPTFALSNVEGFSVFRSSNVADVQFDHAIQERF